ncbi:hypothetical protein AAMO2058_000896300 [Amorphochlora amoebiformis]
MEDLLRAAGSESTGKKEWLEAFQAFKTEFQNVGKPNKFEKKDKDVVIPAILKHISSEMKEKPDWTYLGQGIECLKIMTREMKGLEKLTSAETVKLLMRVLHDKPEFLDEVKAAEHSYAVLVNTFCVDRLKMNSIMEKHAEIVRLMRNLDWHQKKGHMRPYYYLLRIFFYMALVDSVATRIITPAEGDEGKFQSIFKLIARHLIAQANPPKLVGEKNKMNRLCVMELLRTAFNLNYNPKNPKFQDSLDKATKTALQNKLGDIIAIGAEEDPFGERAAEAEFEAEAAKILAIADAQGSNEEKAFLLVEDKSIVDDVKIQMKNIKKGNEKVKVRAVEKKNEEKTAEIGENEEKEWDDALKRVEKGEKAPRVRRPEKKKPPRDLDSENALKLQVINLFIMPGASELLPMSRPEVIQGLAQILDAQAKIDPHYCAEYLLPILSVLLTVCKKSAEARAHMKRFIYRDDYLPPVGYTATKNMEPPAYVNLK